MVRSVLVPLDGSPFGEQALPLAAKIAHLATARLQLVHVHIPVTPIGGDVPLPYDAQLETSLQEAERDYLNKVVQRVRQAAPIAVGAELLDGPVESSLSEYAGHMGVDLVVLTTHGRGVLRRTWLGSVADELVRALHIPMLLVHPQEGGPDPAKPPTIRHVLIPLDGSAVAEQVLEPALALGRLFAADYTVVRVINPAVMGSDPNIGFGRQFDQAMLDRLTEFYQRDQDEAIRYLDRVAERFRARSLSVFTRLLTHEQPAVAILEEARSRQIDMIALATHGRSGFSRLLLGSLADKIVRGACVPVLIQRP